MVPPMGFPPFDSRAACPSKTSLASPKRMRVDGAQATRQALCAASGVAFAADRDTNENWGDRFGPAQGDDAPIVPPAQVQRTDPAVPQLPDPRWGRSPSLLPTVRTPHSLAEPRLGLVAGVRTFRRYPSLRDREVREVRGRLQVDQLPGRTGPRGGLRCRSGAEQSAGARPRIGLPRNVGEALLMATFGVDPHPDILRVSSPEDMSGSRRARTAPPPGSCQPWSRLSQRVARQSPSRGGRFVQSMSTPCERLHGAAYLEVP
jgi:hypothetical protein